MKTTITMFVILAMNFAYGATNEVYSLGELKNENVNATIKDGSGSKLSCVGDKSFFFSSKQQGTHPIRDVYRMLYRFPTLGLYGNGSDNFISVGPMAQYEGIRSSESFETVAECQAAIKSLFAESSDDILTRVPAEVSLSLQLRLTHDDEQQRCRRQVKEIFSLTLGQATPYRFLDILGLTQNNLSSNEAFIEIEASERDCFDIPKAN